MTIPLHAQDIVARFREEYGQLKNLQAEKGRLEKKLAAAKQNMWDAQWDIRGICQEVEKLVQMGVLYCHPCDKLFELPEAFEDSINGPNVHVLEMKPQKKDSIRSYACLDCNKISYHSKSRNQVERDYSNAAKC